MVVYPTLTNMNLRQLHAEVSVDDSDAMIAWCQRYGLIAMEKNCKNCHQAINMVKRSRKDGKTWQCGRPCQTRESIQNDTFFSQSNPCLATIDEFIYAWSYEELIYKKAQCEFKMVMHAFVDWKMFLHGLYAKHFIRNPVQIGGPGRNVEIDEIVFTHRKYNHGSLVREQWVCGGIDTTTKEGFMVPVARRNANTLIPIREEFVIPVPIILNVNIVEKHSGKLGLHLNQHGLSRLSLNSMCYMCNH